MTMEIPLTRGYVALVDDIDYERVSALKWFASVCPGGELIYGVRRYANSRLYLHRFILDCPAGAWIDHIDRNGLDCRRANMRVCEPWQNSLNRRGRLPTKGVRGHRGKYQASITIAGRRIHLGTFARQADALAAYDAAALAHFGKFAWLNSIHGAALHRTDGGTSCVVVADGSQPSPGHRPGRE